MLLPDGVGTLANVTEKWIEDVATYGELVHFRDNVWLNSNLSKVPAVQSNIQRAANLRVDEIAKDDEDDAVYEPISLPLLVPVSVEVPEEEKVELEEAIKRHPSQQTVGDLRAGLAAFVNSLGMAAQKPVVDEVVDEEDERVVTVTTIDDEQTYVGVKYIRQDYSGIWLATDGKLKILFPDTRNIISIEMDDDVDYQSVWDNNE